MTSGLRVTTSRPGGGGGFVVERLAAVEASGDVEGLPGGPHGGGVGGEEAGDPDQDVIAFRAAAEVAVLAQSRLVDLELVEARVFAQERVTERLDDLVVLSSSEQSRHDGRGLIDALLAVELGEEIIRRGAIVGCAVPLFDSRAV